MADQFIAEIQAKLNTSQLENDIKNLKPSSKIKVEVDADYITKQIESALGNVSVSNTKINLGNLFNNSNIQSQAKQYGQSIGQQVQSGIHSIIQKGNFQQEFLFSANNRNNVAKEAQQYFSGISNGVVAVHERMEQLDDASALRGFTVNIKNAEGAVESLRYSLRNITDDAGNVTGQMFKYTGGAINDAGAIKQVQTIENAFADYTQKLAQFKSTNTNILSGLTTPLQDFETKLAGLKSGAYTLDEVKQSFKSLGTEASSITANFTGQLSKTDAAIRKIAQGEETLKGLSAEIKGLNNVPSDAQSQLKNVSNLLQEVNSIEASEGRTANWSAKFREYEDALNSLIAKVGVWKKEAANAASTEIFKTSDLKSAQIPYMTKVYNTIDKQMAEIQKMANAKGWSDFKVTGLENANGQIKSLKLNVTESTGAVKELNFEVAKLDTGKRTQNGLMQTGDVKIIKTAAEATKELEAEQQKLANDMANLQTSYDSGKYQASLKEMTSVLDPFKDMNFDSVSKAKEALSEYESALDSLQKHYSGENILSADELIAQFDKLTNAQDKFKNSMKDVKIDTSFESSFNNIKDKYQDLLTTLDKVQNYDLSKFMGEDGGASGAIKLTDSLEKAKEAKARLDAEMAKGQDADIDAINADLKIMQFELRKADTQWNSLNASANQLNNIKASNATLSWLNDNTRAAKEYGDVLKQLAELQRNAQTSGELDYYTRQAKSIMSEATQKGLTGNGIWDELKRSFSKIGQFTGIYQITSQIQQVPREMISAIIDIDSALTELYKVSDASTSQISDYFDEAAESAKKYGATIDDVISSTADWSRLGYDLNDAKILSDATTLLQTVGDNMDQESASEGLIATLKGFSMDADEVMKIVNSVNQVANTEPIDTAGLFEGLENAASSLDAANNSLEQSIGLITAAKLYWLKNMETYFYRTHLNALVA